MSSLSVSASGAAADAIAAHVPELVADRVASQLFAQDATLWGPEAESESRNAAISPTRGREDRGRPTQDRRTRDSDSASGPHSVASRAKRRLATESSTRLGTCLAIASAAAPAALTDSELMPSPSPSLR